MADPRTYPGGPTQYEEDRHSDDPEVQRRIREHDWANDPVKYPPDNGTQTGSRPPIPDPKKTPSSVSEELGRPRSFVAWGAVLAIFIFTPVGREFFSGRASLSVGWFAYGIIFAALAISSPTAAKRLVAAIIFIGIVVYALGYLLHLQAAHQTH